jgi:lipid A 3-O-deacylase
LDRHLIATLVCALSLAAPQAFADTIVGIAYGDVDRTARAQVDVAIPSRFSGAFAGFDWRVDWNVDVAEWRRSGDGHRHLYDVGFSPGVRLHGGSTAYGRPFVDLGVGVHALSGTRLGNRVLSSAVLFGEFAGIGWQFGPHDAFGISARVIHESNAGIKEPNDGVTAYMVRLEYAFP